MSKPTGTGQLHNKGAVVTGGSRGIGRAIVNAFVEEGARVVTSSRHEPDSDLPDAAVGGDPRQFPREDAGASSSEDEGRILVQASAAEVSTSSLIGREPLALLNLACTVGLTIILAIAS